MLARREFHIVCVYSHACVCVWNAFAGKCEASGCYFLQLACSLFRWTVPVILFRGKGLGRERINVESAVPPMWHVDGVVLHCVSLSMVCFFQLAFFWNCLFRVWWQIGVCIHLVALRRAGVHRCREVVLKCSRRELNVGFCRLVKLSERP